MASAELAVCLKRIRDRYLLRVVLFLQPDTLLVEVQSRKRRLPSLKSDRAPVPGKTGTAGDALYSHHHQLHFAMKVSES